jgi:hypothetical protein
LQLLDLANLAKNFINTDDDRIYLQILQNHQ